MKKIITLLFISELALIIPFGHTIIVATLVKDLRTEYLRNPIGIDVSTPRFSWEMSSDTRGTKQTAYEITVSKDKDGSSPVWKSGKIKSDKSVNIKYFGDTLQPMTRYFWHVDVWDNNNSVISSKDTAYFETSLLATGWSDAKWLKATTTAQSTSEEIQPSEITTYTIKMDFEIKDIAAGPCFGAKDANNYFMWQFNIEEGKSLFRPHSWLNGSGVCHEDKDISSLVTLEKGVTYSLQIDINGDKATTYLNGILVDKDRTNPRGGNYGYANLGFREVQAQYSTAMEGAYFDNVEVTTAVNGKDSTLFKEDFSSATDFAFTAGTVVDGRLLVDSLTYSWQKEETSKPVNFTLDLDVTLKSGNAGIIFSAKDASNMFMWAINTYDYSQPIIRRHIYTDGTPVYTDQMIGQYYSKADLIDHERHVKIEAIDNVIKTYIDNVLVDTYTDTNGKLEGGYIGFRAYKGDVDERAYYDNIVLRNEAGDTLFYEDFENGHNDFYGTETIIVNGNTKLNMYSSSGEFKVLEGQADGIPMFRTKFDVDKEVESARIYSSALGVYDLFINGKRVGTPKDDGTFIYDELKPGSTDLNDRVYYLTYDVTSLLQIGTNAVGAEVSSGWWNGNIAHGIYGTPSLGFIEKLVINYKDGTTKTIVSDPATWLSSTCGPVMMGDIYNGEIYDARRESNWSMADYDDSGWFKTAINTDFKGKLTAFIGPTVQVRPSLSLNPVKITAYNGATATGTDYGAINITNQISGSETIQLKKGETAIYDLGQNMVGWIKFTAKGTSGTRMKLRFGEMTNSTGSLSRGDDGPAGSIYTANLRSAKATLYYTLKGTNKETFNPSMSYFGFRYCEITATDDLEIDSLIGQVVGNVTEEGSSIETSNNMVNQLYSNVMWGQRGNFLSVPTDCPQRDERMGWCGDAQIFCRTAAYNADVASFFHKWMNDMRDNQRSDGAYPVIAPYDWDVGYGQGAWSEAGIIIPWTIYQMYADDGILEENYDSMGKYMDFLAAQTSTGYKYDGAGTAYGDWLSKENTDSRYVSVCYYAYAAQIMSKISKALSNSDGDTYASKAKTYSSLYDNIKTEFQSRYVSSNGTLSQTSQTAYLLALKLDLFPNETARKSAIIYLRNKIADNGNKLSTGFIGTGTLNQTLSLIGENNTAYNLLLQRNNPSWLYSVDQGATTIWERWDSYTLENGFNDVGMNSFNHYSYGAVAEWMYRYMAGIDVDESNPGFKHIILQPSPDTRTKLPTDQSLITSVKAKHDSYYGSIQSNWAFNADGSLNYSTSIPANTTATLYLPLLSDTDIVYEGSLPAENAEGVTFVKKENNKIIYELESGSYSFCVKPTTGTEDQDSKNDFNIYPSPADQILNIAKTPKKYRIADLTGKVQLSGEGVHVDVSKLNAGVYIIYMKDMVCKFAKK